jgi:hypothetical protein
MRIPQARPRLGSPVFPFSADGFGSETANALSTKTVPSPDEFASESIRKDFLANPYYLKGWQLIEV